MSEKGEEADDGRAGSWQPRAWEPDKWQLGSSWEVGKSSANSSPLHPTTPVLPDSLIVPPTEEEPASAEPPAAPPEPEQSEPPAVPQPPGTFLVRSVPPEPSLIRKAPPPVPPSPKQHRAPTPTSYPRAVPPSRWQRVSRPQVAPRSTPFGRFIIAAVILMIIIGAARGCTNQTASDDPADFYHAETESMVALDVDEWASSELGEIMVPTGFSQQLEGEGLRLEAPDDGEVFELSTSASDADPAQHCEELAQTVFGSPPQLTLTPMDRSGTDSGSFVTCKAYSETKIASLAVFYSELNGQLVTAQLTSPIPIRQELDTWFDDQVCSLASFHEVDMLVC